MTLLTGVGQFTFEAADFGLQFTDGVQPRGVDGSQLARFRLSDPMGIGLDGYAQLQGGNGDA